MFEEPNVQEYVSDDPIRGEQIPDDTITLIIKCGGKMYVRKVLLEDTHEKSAKLAKALGQMLVDTVDTIGLKAGGPDHG